MVSEGTVVNVQSETLVPVTLEMKKSNNRNPSDVEL